MFFQGSGVLVALCVLLLRMTLHSDADDAVLAEVCADNDVHPPNTCLCVRCGLTHACLGVWACACS